MAERKGYHLWFWSILAGALLCLNDRFQPFRLKSMQLENFSSDLERTLRDWSETFLAFHPAWVLARQELDEIERRYPISVRTEWSPLRSALKLTAVPFVPAMKLRWHHTEYLAAADGTVWQSELWNKALSLEVPDVPELDVGTGFPLLEENGAASPTRLNVPFQWLFDVWRAPSALGDLKVSGLELLRRGGDDLIKCVIKNEKNGNQISFLGRVSGLEKSLLVVRELMSGKTTETSSIDATYEDKIIIKKTQKPRSSE